MKLKIFALILATAAITGSCKKSDSTTGGGGTTPATAAITALSCASISFNAVATANVAYSATATVPYSGGNGVAYLAGTSITSSGVTGLTATLQAGTLANGTGNLSFTVSGTPAAAGTAIFSVSFGSQTCSASLIVNPAGGGIPSITALACASGSFSATATVATAYNAIATIPYNGGNGLAYATGAAIASTGVTGLTATLIPGTLASGTGNLSYIVTGTPAAVGTATFAINFGGQNCSINLTVNNTGGTPTLPAVYNKIYGATSITFDGTWVTIKYNALPDHKSAYYPTANALYEAFSGTTFGGGTFMQNPNTIAVQNITLKIPVNPVVAATHATTPMGVMGVALNGVPFFNQYAAGGSPLTNEINGFDQWWGHPQNTGMYHYHVEPKYLTTVKASKSALMGFLLDGFPVYGPEETNGSAPAGLDVYHGHTHVTVDYPAGIYHYHISTAAPYINGNGFYGTPGTVTQ
jgi:YHYH protein